VVCSLLEGFLYKLIVIDKPRAAAIKLLAFTRVSTLVMRLTIPYHYLMHSEDIRKGERPTASYHRSGETLQDCMEPEELRGVLSKVLMHVKIYDGELHLDLRSVFE
jgi:hypothetical protein